MRSTILLIFGLAIPLAACNISINEDDNDSADTPVQQRSSSDNLADSMASNDYGDREEPELAKLADSKERPIMQAQVTLDRRGFGPGVIDGKMGLSTENALEGFQEANGLEVTGALDDATKSRLLSGKQYAATRVVRIPSSWSDTTYTAVPDDPEEQAKMDRLGYGSLDERLAERFHTTVAVLEELNPNGRPAGMPASANTGNQAKRQQTGTATAANAASSASEQERSTGSVQGAAASGRDSDTVTTSVFKPGQLVRVPNIGGDRIAAGSVDDPSWQQTLTMLGVGSDQPKVARVVVSKSDDTLKAFGADGKLIALYTVTSGSSNDPLPLGNWKITGVAKNPPFAYDPDLFWDVPDSDEDLQLPPGPNGPVGVVWIDLSKEHYGIHGTPAPETIGRAKSHGCVRLTNWDAARLAQMVHTRTKVEFIA